MVLYFIAAVILIIASLAVLVSIFEKRQHPGMYGLAMLALIAGILAMLAIFGPPEWFRF